MAETKSMRVVPSGKIYRQMFEAQVQLNRSLTKIQRDSTTVTKSSQLGASVPVVHLTKDDIEHGLLDERQRTWADGFPNDPFTENPVAYKQYAEYIGSQMKEPVSSIEGREVRGLPDVVVAAKDKSNIIERFIAASRKERHESTVDEMQQELSLINALIVGTHYAVLLLKRWSPAFSEACSGLLQRLEEDDKEIARKLARIETDKVG
ncbi:coiled-coil domain-containing protein 180-like [Dreissena polymorpha]|uniref:coiled-coil domain-containing protein 180-like n=1 Tax=Dreissena polymorpha TaxID=45954 RepID=UPI0022645E41|nr:coiled-coil domain-containing protein 180-like [Dreissena polymorpha]